MKQYKMLPNIWEHSLTVAGVADQIVQGLNQSAAVKTIDRNLVVYGALLHDIAKTICLDGSCSHAAVGAEICMEHGYPEIAEIVGEHVYPKSYHPENHQKGQFLPLEIVYYADKRVNHSQIVSLNERIAYIIERYGKNDPAKKQQIKLSFERCCELERHLFAHLDFSPDQLKKL